MDKLIAHVYEKKYAYGEIHAENQNLLFIISELKTRLANVEKDVPVKKGNLIDGKSISKERRLHGSTALSTWAERPIRNFFEQRIAAIMVYRGGNRIVIGMNATSSVRRPMNRDSHVKNSVLANSKKPAKKVVVYVRKNKQTDIISENVISNK
ncbi:hypothetical protein Tco_0155528 [Tanacetum coccineum]